MSTRVISNKDSLSFGSRSPFCYERRVFKRIRRKKKRTKMTGKAGKKKV